MSETAMTRAGRRAIVTLALLGSPAAGTQGIKGDEVEMSSISGTVDNPRRHFRLKNAEPMSPVSVKSPKFVMAGCAASSTARGNNAVLIGIPELRSVIPDMRE